MHPPRVSAARPDRVARTLRPTHAALLAASCLAAGLGLGVMLQPAPPLEVPAATAAPPTATAPADLSARLDRIESNLEALHSTVSLATGGGGTGTAGISTDQIASAARRELERARITAPGAEEKARAEQEALEAKPENQEAHARAERVVTAAITARRWTQEDAMALRESLGTLSGRQASALLERLIPAVNRGEVEVETTGPLF